MRTNGLLIGAGLLMLFSFCMSCSSSEDEPKPDENVEEKIFHERYEITRFPITGNQYPTTMLFNLDEFPFSTEEIDCTIVDEVDGSLWGTYTQRELFVYLPTEGGDFTLTSGRPYKCIIRDVFTDTKPIPEGCKGYGEYLSKGNIFTGEYLGSHIFGVHKVYTAVEKILDVLCVVYKDDENVRTGKLEVLGCEFDSSEEGKFACKIGANDTGLPRVIGVYICENHENNTESPDNEGRIIYIYQPAAK